MTDQLQGLSAPLFGAVVENAALFVGYDLAQQAIRRWGQREGHDSSHSTERTLSMVEQCLGRGMDGVRLVERRRVLDEIDTVPPIGPAP